MNGLTWWRKTNNPGKTTHLRQATTTLPHTYTLVQTWGQGSEKPVFNHCTIQAPEMPLFTISLWCFLICNKDVALEAMLLKTVLILIRICLFYFKSCCKLFSTCANPSIFQIVLFFFQMERLLDPPWSEARVRPPPPH